MVIISSSECFFLMLCAFSGQPDKLVEQTIRHTLSWDNVIIAPNISLNRQVLNWCQGAITQKRTTCWLCWSCIEIKWSTDDLTFCEWQTHYWHVQGHCSQARDNGAVPVYWPSRQRVAHWWTTPSVFWQQVDNCLHCGGMCIFPIHVPVRHIQLLDTYQGHRQRVADTEKLQMQLKN